MKTLAVKAAIYVALCTAVYLLYRYATLKTVLYIVGSIVILLVVVWLMLTVAAGTASKHHTEDDDL